MRFKPILLSIFLSLNIIAAEYNIDFFISRRINESIEAKLLDTRIDREEARENYLYFGKYNDLKISANSFYRKDYLELESEYVTNTLELKYGIFEYKLDYNWTDKEVTTERVGIVKNLKEFTYNEYDHARNIQEVQKRIDINRQLITRNNDITRIIMKYGEVKKLEADLEVKTQLLKAIEQEYERAKKIYEEVDEKPLEYDLAKFRIDYINLDIKRLNENIKNTKAELLALSDLDLGITFELKEIPDTVSLDYSLVHNFRLENAKLEIEKAEYLVKYEKYKTLPNVEVVSDYDFIRDGYRLGVRFNDTLQITDGVYKDMKYNLEERKLELEKAIKARDIVIKTLEKEYARLLNTYSIRLTETEYKKKEVVALRSSYVKGDISFIEYTDKVNELEEGLSQLYKTEQDLLVFKYSIKYVQ